MVFVSFHWKKYQKVSTYVNECIRTEVLIQWGKSQKQCPCPYMRVYTEEVKKKLLSIVFCKEIVIGQHKRGMYLRGVTVKRAFTTLFFNLYSIS